MFNQHLKNILVQQRMTINQLNQPQARPYPPRVAFLQRLVTTFHTLVYRLSGGKIGGTVLGCPVLLLTTIGRRTGLPRTAPLLYLPDGQNVVLVASNGGTDKHPTWWLNLESHPRALVEIGGRRVLMRAEEAGPAERARLWPLVVAMYRGYEQYQARTPRQIPLAVLHPLPNA
jgi:deazaflavin-dependent oxidoreductase (nitroreductase family)